MMNKNNDFSSTDWMKMLRQPQTQALIARLQQLDSSAIEAAAQLAANGDTEGAKALLSPLLKDEQVQNLTQQLREQHGGI